VKRLTDAGFDMKTLSVVGKGYHTNEKVVGFYLDLRSMDTCSESVSLFNALRGTGFRRVSMP
jgi:hypothetical protein